jgi:DNA modification methylase
MGSGTTAVVARKLNRNYVGFELNPEYVEIAGRKLKRELGLFV